MCLYSLAENKFAQRYGFHGNNENYNDVKTFFFYKKYLK